MQDVFFHKRKIRIERKAGVKERERESVCFCERERERKRERERVCRICESVCWGWNNFSLYRAINETI